MKVHRNNALLIKMDENSLQEVAEAGFQSLENLIRLLSSQSQSRSYQTDTLWSSSSSLPVRDTDSPAATDYTGVADVAVAKFKKILSLLDRNRSGHARFRRGPASNPPQNHQNVVASVENLYSPSPITDHITSLPQTHLHHSSVKPGSFDRKDFPVTTLNFAAAASASQANSSVSSLTGDTGSLQPSMSSGFQISNLSQFSSGGQSNLSSSSFKRKCKSVDDSHTECAKPSGRCHCSKKRKSKLKRVVRVPAISMKMTDIPPDDYAWRKYGQKPIKGSPHPRGYYRCSSFKGCPAKKHVERAMDASAMLIVTYQSEHDHTY